MNPEEQQSYVYPHPETPWQASAKPPKKNSATRIIGFAAIFFAAAILFTAIGGGIAYSFLNRNGQLTETTTTNSSTQATSQLTDNTSIDDNNKHWSVVEAATLPDGEKKALSIINIAKMGKPAVVAINTTGTVPDFFGQSGSFEAAGSGFIVSSDGYIVTNNHVLESAEKITVITDNGDVYPATLIGTDLQNDLAVIKIEAQNLPYVIFGDSSTLQVGELAVAIGNPLGELSGSVTAGIISALDRQITLGNRTLNLLQTDAAINPGNSGGALFNSFGEVIGVNTAKTSETGIEGLGFAIPINDAKPIIESIVNYGYMKGRTIIGISTSDQPNGIYINLVEPGSPAETAGLRQGDIIIAVNDKDTLTINQLADIKATMKPGDSLVMTILRNDAEIKVTVILAEDVPD